MLGNLRREKKVPICKKPEEAPEYALKMGIKLDKLPEHIAFIMDGNGRWALGQGMARTMGHSSGVKVVKELVKTFRYLNIPVMTVYAFSTENWKRSNDEVDFLMNLFEDSILKECSDLKKNGVRVKFIGRIHELRPALQEKIRWIEEETKEQTGLTLNVAANYGGRAEIIDATIKIAEELKNGTLKKENLTEEHFNSYLYTSAVKDPDLIIRTSGEVRLSNYLLWQAAYSEIWVTQTRWPDFSVAELLNALLEFQNRDRRFGKVK